MQVFISNPSQAKQAWSTGSPTSVLTLLCVITQFSRDTWVLQNWGCSRHQVVLRTSHQLRGVLSALQRLFSSFLVSAPSLHAPGQNWSFILKGKRLILYFEIIWPQYKPVNGSLTIGWKDLYLTLLFVHTKGNRIQEEARRYISGLVVPKPINHLPSMLTVLEKGHISYDYIISAGNLGVTWWQSVFSHE